MKDRALPWHKMKTGKQNQIIIAVCVVISLCVIGVFSLLIH